VFKIKSARRYIIITLLPQDAERMEATLLLSQHVEARTALREAENRDVGTMALCESRTPQRGGRLSSPCSGNVHGL